MVSMKSNDISMWPRCSFLFVLPGDLTDQKENADIFETDHQDNLSHGDGDERFLGGGGIIDLDDPGQLGNEIAPPRYSPPPYSEEEPVNIEDIKYSLPVLNTAPPRLNCPVVIPQRRPGSKGRGFMRAYAPVLSDYDISEEFFLAFLKTFHKASMVSDALLQICYSVRDSGFYR